VGQVILMAFMKKSDPKVTPMERVKKQPVQAGPVQGPTTAYAGFAEFFNRNDAYVEAAQLKSDGYEGSTIYPSATGRSAFSMSLSYGVDASRKDPNDVQLNPNFE